MTYNFDPDRWYDNERAFLKAKLDRGEIDRRAFDEAMQELDRKYAEMWRRLDGSYTIPKGG